MTCVLFACVHNAGRSQVAAAFFNRFADPSLASAISAGTQPADEVHPQVVNVMRETGIDLSEVKPKLLTPELAGRADFLVTMGCEESCPVVPGVKREDWQLPDPHGQSVEQVRRIRDEIRTRVLAMIRANGWERRSGTERAPLRPASEPLA